MNEALSIAATAINAATTEIATTSENIANAQTPGYAVERAQLSPLPGGSRLGVGEGVQVTSIAQVASALLSANNLQAQGALQALTASQQVLTGIQNVFPLGQSSAAAASSSQGSSNTSIAGQLASFWSSWDAIAQDPSGAAPRTQVLDQAKGLTVSLNEAAAQLSQLATNTVGQVQGQVSQVNGLLTQAAKLNEQIAATSGGGASPNQLVDQLNQVTGQLGQLAGVNVHQQANGTAVVSIGGIALVQGNHATTLQLSASTDAAGTTTASIATDGGTPVSVSSGSIAGLMSGLGPHGSISTYQASLNDVAAHLASIVNTQLEAGYTATGAPGTALFTAAGGGAITAATIGVAPTLAADPSLIAAATNPAAAANDGSNAQAMAEFATQPSATVTGPGGTTTTVQMPDVTYQNLVENIGSATQAVNNQVSGQTSVANQAQQALQSATGVNQNAELTNLVQFQAAYQASAKLVGVISTTIQSLLQAV